MYCGVSVDASIGNRGASVEASMGGKPIEHESGLEKASRTGFDPNQHTVRISSCCLRNWPFSKKINTFQGTRKAFFQASRKLFFGTKILSVCVPSIRFRGALATGGHLAYKGI